VLFKERLTKKQYVGTFVALIATIVLFLWKIIYKECFIKKWKP
jgi:hypothetical protein